MQTGLQGTRRNSYSAQPYSPEGIFGKKIRFILLLFLVITFSNSAVRSQSIPQKVRDVTKELNITVGKKIDNEATRKVLKVIDRVPGLSLTIRRYNERFGNDSVHAERFVDREPDESGVDTLLKNYYDVVVICDSAKQTSRWYSFLVRKDLSEVRYYDLENAKTGSMDQWRKIWPASEFLKGRE